MNNFTENNSSLLERRQQTSSFLEPLELPSLPPLSQLLTEKQKLEKQQQQLNSLPITPNTQAAAEAALAAASAVTSSMITSTTQSLMQGNTANLEAENMLLSHTAPSSNMMLQQELFHSTFPNILDTNSNTMAPHFMERQRQSSVSSTSSDKIYSFVSPIQTHKKRPRRRYDEIERLYHCTWPGCTKSYGTLNHLNAHVSMQQHGPKRHPAEFKEMRKEWRRQKKAREAAKKSAEMAFQQQQAQQHAQQQHMLQQNNYNFQQLSFIPTTANSANMTLDHFY